MKPVDKMPNRTMKDPKISELTVSQLQKLIRKTVQQAVAEVIIEMSMVSQMQEEDQIEYEADLTEYLRQSINSATPPALNQKHDD